MQRRSLSLAGLVLTTGLLAHCAPAPARTATPAADDTAVRQTIVDWYAAYSGTNEDRYRSFVTDDYVLLENGEPMGIDGDLQAMRSRPPGYRRTDTFDFRSVTIAGDVAYAWYLLGSEIADSSKVEQRKWLESAVLRRANGRWRAALLHSTRIARTASP